MSFVNECIQDSIPIWEQCLRTDFLHKMATGTLEEDCLKGYIIDDSLYLREYAKVFAWGITKAKTMEDIRNCYSLLAFVNENENAARLVYLKRFGLHESDIQHLPQRKENKAYTDYMLNVAQNGGMIECMMACLPCMISYSWLFHTLLKRFPNVRNTSCGLLVCDYADETYTKLCMEWCTYTDHLCQNLSHEQKAVCLETFRTCSMYELQFWEMSAHPRNDIIE